MSALTVPDQIVTESGEETEVIGSRLADLILAEGYDFSCVVLKGGQSVGKSTFLYGLVSAFVDVSRKQFALTQRGALPRIFTQQSSAGLIISYDTKTYGMNPNTLYGESDIVRLLCIEHPDLIDLNDFGVTPDYSVEIVKTGFKGFSSPRQITIETP